MKAAVFHKFGDADVLKVEDVPTPKPKAGHVIEVSASLPLSRAAEAHRLIATSKVTGNLGLLPWAA